MAKEKTKSAVIILLIIALIGLVYLTVSKGILSSPVNSVFSGNKNSYFELWQRFDLPESRNVLLPDKIAFTNGDEFFGVQYDTAHKKQIFDKLLPIYFQALENLSEIQRINGITFSEYTGVYFDFLGNIPIELVAGRSYEPDFTVRKVFFNMQATQITIYFKNDYGDTFSAKTNINSESLGALIRGLSAYPAFWGLENLPEDNLFIDEDIAVSLESSSIFGSNERINQATYSQISTAFFNTSAIPGFFIDKENARVYVSEEGTLRVSQSGKIEFSCGKDGTGISLPASGNNSISGYVGFAKSIIEDCAKKPGDNTSYYLIDCISDGGKKTINFGLAYNGVPLIRENKITNYCTVVFDGDIITDFIIIIKKYTSAEAGFILPFRLAIGAVNENPELLELSIGYFETETLCLAKWYLR